MAKHKQQPQMSGDEKIIKCANALLAAITEQGYCVTNGDSGILLIHLHDVTSGRGGLAVDNFTNSRQPWRIDGKITAPLITVIEEEENK